MKFLSLIMILACAPLAFAAQETAHDHDTLATATAPYASAAQVRDYGERVKLFLRSHVALVYDERDNETILARNAEDVMPVASLTKLVTAMVVLDGGQPLDEVITITSADKDRLRYSKSRLKFGMQFTRQDLLLITLAASENRAAAALARSWPGGMEAFVAEMNRKVQRLGLTHTRFADPAGLSNDNVSTAQELVRIVRAASQYFMIREFTTQTRETITDHKSGREVAFGNTNRLVNRDSWPVSLSKTGFTSDAGNCLVMQTEINNRPLIVVLLNSWGKLSKYGDSNRIRQWLTKTERLIEKRQFAERSNARI